MPDIAGDALRYKGAGYTYGGAPAAGIGHWDCSSFISWVLGHDLKMAIPGIAAGAYTGTSHGPVVLDYASWNGASTTKSPSRGDLVIWPGLGATGHIGIFLQDNQMISALNHAYGTAVTPIQGYGPAGVPNIYRTVSGNSSGGISVPSGCNIAALLGTSAIMLIRKARKRAV